MGFRRRTRRRALVAGAAIGHHRASQQQQAYDEAPAEHDQGEPQYAPPPPPAPAPAAGNDLSSRLNQLAQLHASGVLSDEEFTAAKQKVLAGG